jgi:V/A-type H+/Na+-transporting ATPase subunit C
LFAFDAPRIYGYSTGRVKAMKSLLLRPAHLDEMIKVRNVEAMVELLQKTDYKPDLAAAALGQQGSRIIEMGVSRNFSKVVKKLVGAAPKTDKKALRALLIRWELNNIKILLNARRIGKNYEEVRPYLFEVGGMDEEDFASIMKADEAGLARELRKTELGVKMLNLVPGGGHKQDAIAKLEIAADSEIYTIMDRALAGTCNQDVAPIRRLLKKEADARNIMIIERLKLHGTPRDKIEASLLHGGTLDRQVIGRLLEAKELSALPALLKQRFPNLEVKGEGRKALAELEISLEKSLAAQKLKAFHASVLSVGVIMGFLLLKEEEINNLRKVAKGKEFNMPESEVRDMLVII